MLLLFIIGLFTTDTYELVPQKTMAPIPETVDLFLQDPSSLEMDSRNHVYVVDLVSKVIFHWDEKGQFVGAIGKSGNGPGEFRFQNFGDPQGYLQIKDDTLYVFDGGKNAILTFKPDGQYLETIKLDFQTGRSENFYLLKDGRFALQNQNFMAQPPTRTLTLADAEGHFEKYAFEIDDKTFKRENDGERMTGLVIKAYSPSLVTGFNPVTQELLAGDSGEPAFTIINLEKNTRTKVKLGLAEQDVTQEDKDEMKSLPWIKNNPFFKFEFPDKKAFYNSLLPVGSDDFLVYWVSPFTRNNQGIYVTRSGQTLGRFAFKCGENGSLQGTRGKIFGIYLNDEDEFTVSELALKKK